MPPPPPLRPPRDEEIAARGKQAVIQLVILFKTALIHDPANIALAQPTENLVKTLAALLRDVPGASGGSGGVALRLERDILLLDEAKLRMDLDAFLPFTLLMDEMKKREVGTIFFKAGVSETDLRRFAYAFINLDARAAEPFARLKAALAHAGVGGVDVEPLEERTESATDRTFEDKKEMAKRIYFNTISAVHEVMESVKLKQAVSLKKAKRVIQGMVDLILQEDATLLGLTNLRSHDEYTYNHSVNVCILALAIGQRLGYLRPRLADLGMAALFHDIGKSAIPIEILNKPKEFTDDEWTIVRRHPIFSVKELVRIKGIAPLAIKVTIGAFEHHLNYDLSGYPKLASPRKVSLFGRIICIVDCYDALTSSRVYNRIPFPPERALKFMLGKSGQAFDPVLLKIFVNAIGIYPIGTLVLLDSQEIAVVYAPPPIPDAAEFPKVKVVADASGNEVDGETRDLASAARRGDVPRGWKIVRTIDPTPYRFDVAKYFL